MGDRGVEFIKGNEGIGAGEEKPAQAGGQLAPSPIALREGNRRHSAPGHGRQNRCVNGHADHQHAVEGMQPHSHRQGGQSEQCESSWQIKRSESQRRNVESVSHGEGGHSWQKQIRNDQASIADAAENQADEYPPGKSVFSSSTDSMETYEEEQTDHGRAFQYERRQGNDVAGYENGEVNDHGAHKRHQLDRHTFKLMGWHDRILFVSSEDLKLSSALIGTATA